MLTDVYRPSEVSDHICPIALTLGADRVAEVKLISYKLVSIKFQRTEYPNCDVDASHVALT